MSKLLSTLLISLLLFCPLSIQADETRAQNRQEMRELKHQEVLAKAKQKLLRLKDALKLQSDQQQAWESYEASILENLGKKRNMAKQLKEKYRDTDLKPNALELAQANVARLELKLAKAQNQFQALEIFYGQLNEEQKLKIDKVMLRKIKHEAKRLRKMHKERKQQKQN